MIVGRLADSEFQGNNDAERRSGRVSNGWHGGTEGALGRIWRCPAIFCAK